MEALTAIGAAYRNLIEEDRAMLQGQLQAYAASCDDADVRASTSRGYGRLVDYVEAVSGADRGTVARFFATGMLLNVLAALELSLFDAPGEAWARGLAEGYGES